MESLIKEIIKLDNKTKDFVKKSNQELEEARSLFQKDLNDFELKNHEEGRSRAQAAYEEVYQEAMEEVEEITRANKKKLDQVEEVYRKNKEDLLDQALEILGL